MSDRLVSVERQGTVDHAAEDTGKFPFDAFEFNPGTGLLTLRAAWTLAGIFSGTGTALSNAITGTAAALASSNPVLLVGQIGYETDTKYFKIGDGATAYASLSYQFKQVLYTPEAAYTPTLVGFGTPTNVNFTWTRIGNRLKVFGKFTCGTSTAVEAKIGFPGTLVSDGALITSVVPCGMGARDGGGGTVYQCIVDANVGYVNLDNSSNQLTKVNANTVLSSGVPFGLWFEVPISGWNV